MSCNMRCESCEHGKHRYDPPLPPIGNLIILVGTCVSMLGAGVYALVKHREIVEWWHGLVAVLIVLVLVPMLLDTRSESAGW